jgi:hypothetical protein
VSVADTRCRCYGIDRRTRCERDATQEDGLCDLCRCPHGGCDGHWPDDPMWTKDLFFDDPTAFMEGLQVSIGRASLCLVENGGVH